MILLGAITISVQILIIKDIFFSRIWRIDRKNIECIKVLYCSVAIACFVTLATLSADVAFGCFNSISTTIKFVMYSLILMHSANAMKAISIYNIRRLRTKNIKEKEKTI